MVEGTSGPFEGHVRSRGGSEEDLGWLGHRGGSSLRGGRVDDSGVSGEVGVGLCAAARTLTRVTSTGAAGAFGVGSELSGSAKSAARSLGSFGPEAPDGQKWQFG
jgi:hypothetical protein